MNEGLSIADAMALTRENDGLFTGNGTWVFFLFFLLAWGNGGFFGNGFGGYGYGGSPALQGALTRAELTDGFNTQNIVSKLDNISNSICDLGYSELGNFNNVMANMNSGFNNVMNGITAVGYQFDSGLCSVNRNIDSVKFEDKQNTMNIIEAVNNVGQRIIDRMTEDKIDDLRTELQSAQLQISNNVQTSNLINALRPFPQPAYITCSPYQSNATTVTTSCPYA